MNKRTTRQRYSEEVRYYMIRCASILLAIFLLTVFWLRLNG